MVGGHPKTFYREVRLKRLKIVHILPFYDPVIGGMEELVKNIAESLVSKGHEVDIFTADSGHRGKFLGRPKTEKIGGVNVFRFRPLFQFGFISFFPGIIPALFKKDYDIIHLHAYRHFHTEIGSWVGRWRGIPTVLHGHGPFYYQNISRFKLFCYRFYDKLVKHTVLKNVSSIIAFTKIEREAYIERGADSGKIVIIPNGVRDIFFGKSAGGGFLKVQGLSDKKIVLSVGRIHPNKRLDVLVNAFAEVLKHEPNAFLVLIGPDGGGYAALEALAKNLNLGQHFKWLGVLESHETLAEAYASAACFVLPSDYEPFGLVMLEAMAASKPVVAVNTGGPSEIIKDGETGFLIERGNARQLEEKLLFLLKNAQVARKMGERAAKKAEEFGLRRIVDKIEENYYRLQEQRHSRGL